MTPRPRIGVRGRLFVVSIAVIVFGLLAMGVVIENEVREFLEDRVEEELRVAAMTMSGTMEHADLAEADAIADRLGAASGLRISVIAPDGRLLGDSELPAAALTEGVSRADRPEVARALSSGDAASERRYSVTLERDALYVAVPFGGEPALGVLRVAMPLVEVDEVVSTVRWLLIIAGLVGLGVAAAMSGLASHLVSKELRKLVKNASEVGRSGGKGRVPVSSSDEVGVLAGSINRLAEELDKQVKALAAERDRFETVLEGMGEALLALDGQARITLANPAALEMLALPASPIGASLIETVRSPKLRELASEGLEGPSSAEFVLPGPERRRVLARATPLRGSTGVVIVMHDVTERRRLETIRKDFVANVSHELRTPVAVMRANAETLLDGALDQPKRARSFTEAILRNAERLSALLSDLLDLSRIESGKFALSLEPVRLGDVTMQVAEDLAPMAADKDIHLDFDVPEVLLQADAKALEHVLSNLVGNGIKYTPAGGLVTLTAHEDGDGIVRIEVIDNGPGIDPIHRARIFERFYRADEGRSRDVGGTGLGLAIVKHLVEAMDGTVGVDPVHPNGSNFWVRLRAAAGKAAGDAPDDTDPSPA